MKRVIVYLLLAVIALPTFAEKKKSYWFQRSEEYYQNQDYESCLNSLEQGVTEDPKDAYCWAVMAEIYSKRAFAQYGKALEASEQALKYMPKKDTYWMSMIYGIRGDIYYKVEEYEQSAVAYEQAVKLLPERAEFRFSLADVYTELKRYDEAIALMQKIVEDDPAESYVQAVLARTYLEHGDTLLAEKHVKLSLALQPDNNQMAHYVLFNLAWGRGNKLQAAREYLEILHQHGTEVTAHDSLRFNDLPLLLAATHLFVNESPNDPINVAYHAGVLYEEGLYAEAYIWQKKAAAMDEEQETQLAGICNELGLWEESEEILTRQLKQDSTLHGALAHLYMCKGDYEKAIEQNKLSMSAEQPEYIYRNISRALLNMGRYDEAMLYMDTAIVLADKQSTGTMLFNRGELFDCMGQPDKAREDYRNAEQNVESDKTQAYISALLGNAAAVQHYVDSVLPTIHGDRELDDLAEIYACLRDADNAVKYMRMAFEHGRRTLYKANMFRYRFIVDNPAWQALLEEIEQTRLADLQTIRRSLQSEAGDSAVTEIPFKKQGGVNQVQCTINGLQLYFVFDTGASDVSISNVEANFMLKNGYLTESDFMGKQNFVTATGEIHEGTIINLREVRVGDIVLTNIKASVVKNQNAPLLLGQSVFRRFGKVEVDNNASVIRFVK